MRHHFPFFAARRSRDDFGFTASRFPSSLLLLAFGRPQHLPDVEYFMPLRL